MKERHYQHDACQSTQTIKEAVTSADGADKTRSQSPGGPALQVTEGCMGERRGLLPGVGFENILTSFWTLSIVGPFVLIRASPLLGDLGQAIGFSGSPLAHL